VPVEVLPRTPDLVEEEPAVLLLVEVVLDVFPAADARIRTLLAAGLPTRVIRELMPCFAGDGTALQACVLDHLRTQMDDLDSRIADLTRARTALGDILHASTRALA
jgi:MerR, DNA binding